MMSAQFSQPMGPYAGNTGATPSNGYMLMSAQQGPLVALVTGSQGGARLIHIPHPSFYQGNPAIVHQHQLNAMGSSQAGVESCNASTLALMQQQQQQQHQQHAPYYQSHSQPPHSQQQQQAAQQQTIFIRPNTAAQSGMQLIPVFDVSSQSAASSATTSATTPHYGIDATNQFVSPVALFNTAALSSSTFGRQFVSVAAGGGGGGASSTNNNAPSSTVIATPSLSHPMALFQGHPSVAYMPGLVTAPNVAGPALLVPPLLSCVGVASATGAPPMPRGLLSPSGGQSQLSHSQNNNTADVSSADGIGSTASMIPQQPPVPLFRPPQAQLILSSTSQKAGVDLVASDGSLIPNASADHPVIFEKRSKSRAESINDLLILAVNSGSWDYRGNEAEEKQKADNNQPPASISGPYCSRLLRMDIAAHLYEMQPPILVEELKQMYMNDVLSEGSSDLFTDFFCVQEGDEYYLGYRTKLVLQFDVEGAVLPLSKLEDNEQSGTDNDGDALSHDGQVMHIQDVLEKYMHHIYETLHWSQSGVRFQIAWPPSHKSVSESSTASSSESMRTSKISIQHTRHLPIYVSGLTLSQIDEFGTAIGREGLLEKLEIHLPSNSCCCCKALCRMPGFKRRADFNDRFTPLAEAAPDDSLSKLQIDSNNKDESLPSARVNAPASSYNETTSSAVNSSQSLTPIGINQPNLLSSQSLMDAVSGSNGSTSTPLRHTSTNRHVYNPPASGNSLLSMQPDRPPRFQRQLLNAVGGQVFSMSSGPVKREGGHVGESTDADGASPHNDPRIHEGISSRRGPGAEDTQSRSKPYEDAHDYRSNSSYGFRGRGRGFHGYGGERTSGYSDNRDGRYPSSGRGGSTPYRGRGGRGGGGGGAPYAAARGHNSNKFSVHGAPDAMPSHQDPSHNSPPGTSRRSGGPPVSSPDLNEGNFPSLSASSSNGHAAHQASRVPPVARKQPVSNPETGGGNSASASVSAPHRYPQYFPNSVPGAKKAPFTEKARKEEKL